MATVAIGWKGVWPLAGGGMFFAPIAATLVQQVPADTLAQIFAVWLILIGIRTLWRSRSTPEG